MPDKPKMLVVGDEPINRAILARTFSDEYQVIEADDGDRALEILGGEPDFAIILLDIFMKRVNGFEVLKAIKGDPALAGILVIISTAEHDERNEMTALSLQCDGFFTKPYTSDLIRQRVASIVRKREFDRAQKDIDLLTGLWNRSGFCKAAEQILRSTDEGYLVIVSDIDSFKSVNETFGSAKGDQLLRLYAISLQTLMDDRSVCGRLDADHFAALIPSRGNDSLERLNALDKDIFSQNLIDFSVTVYLGVCRVTDRSAPVEQMCDRAAFAISGLKGSQARLVAYYDQSMSERIIREKAFLSELDQALAKGQFVVYFQPVYDAVSGQLAAAEALVRWIHPLRGLIPPGEFIPAFEKAGVITKLDRYVWNETAKALGRLKQLGGKAVPVSVNVSRLNLYSRDFISYLEQLVREHDIDKRLLRLEITESAYTQNPSQLMKILEVVEAHGFRILMDDFGSGYSSLNMLKDAHIDILKIDMRFVEGLEASQRSGNLLASVVRMAKGLDLDVVAEGVETKAQLDFLRSVGCDYIQGYYFSKPLPYADFAELLRRRGRIVRDPAPAEGRSADLSRLWDANPQTGYLFSLAGSLAVFQLDRRQLELVRANDAYLELLGIRAAGQRDHNEELDFLAALEPKDRSALRGACKAAKRTDQLRAVVFRHQGQGGLKWLTARIRYLGDDHGRETYIFALSDASARCGDTAAKQRERLFQALQGVYDEIYELNYTDNRYQLVYASAFAARSFPREGSLEERRQAVEAQCIDPAMREVYHHDNQLSVIREAIAQSPGNTYSCRFRFRPLGSRGRYHWCEKTFRRVTDPYGKEVYFAGLAYLGPGQERLSEPKSPLDCLGPQLLGDLALAVLIRRGGECRLVPGKDFSRFQVSGHPAQEILEGRLADADLAAGQLKETKAAIRALAKAGSGRLIAQLARKDGSPRQVCFTAYRYRKPAATVLILSDVTGLVRSTDRQGRDPQLSGLYHSLLTHFSDYIFEYDPRTDLLRYDSFGRGIRDDGQKIERFTEYLKSSPVFYAKERPAILKSLRQGARLGKSGQAELRLALATSRYRWHRVYYETAYGAQGEPRLIGRVDDITAEKRRTGRLADQATRDALTRLLNRREAERLVDQELKSLNSGEEGVLYFVDLDRFKEINDTLGHLTGDEALKRAAHELKSLFRSRDLVARVGGDEFMAFMKTAQGSPIAAARAEEMVLAISQIYLDGYGCLSGSVGIAKSHSRRDTYRSLIPKADQAMYKVKNGRGNGFGFYDGHTGKKK